MAMPMAAQHNRVQAIPFAALLVEESAPQSVVVDPPSAEGPSECDAWLPLHLRAHPCQRLPTDDRPRRFCAAHPDALAPVHTRHHARDAARAV
jgi:hypothetical protein